MEGIALASLLVWLYWVTGLPAWIAEIKAVTDRQRAAAARAWAYYACAPLAWIPPLAILIGVLLGLSRSYYWEGTVAYHVGLAILITAAVLALLAPIAWLAVAALLVGRMSGSRWRGAAVAVLVLPLGAVGAAAIFLGLTFLLNYGALLLYSLRR
jgi:hypothetical protein